MAMTNIITNPEQNFASLTAYKSYVAVLTQTETDNPVATVFNADDSNFLGNIVWTRTGVGNYAGTLAGALPDAKTLVSCQVISNTAAITFAFPQPAGPDAIFLVTGDNPYGYAQTGAMVDIGGNGVLIKIEVYQ